MNWRACIWVLPILLGLQSSACSTKVYVRSYPIEQAEGPYKRIRIAVPTAGAGAVATAQVRAGNTSVTARTAVVDASNILAIVQNEVMRSLQGAGHKVVLVQGNAELDLQISFDAPAPRCDLKCYLSLTALPLYQSVGGAKLIDSASGKVIATYELNTEIRALRSQPPIRIGDWEDFAKKLAAEIQVSLEALELAELPSQDTLTL